MIEGISNSLPLVFSFNSILMMSIGSLIGIIMGALPGMTATMTVAILVSFTFGMQPLPGMMLLLGIYGGALYGGSMPAILIRTPGTPSAAATVYDGYPMSLRGEAGLAIGVSTFSSFFGGIIGLTIALFVSSWVAEFALRFGSAEYFALAVFGLTIIANISEGAVIKGFIAGILGFFLSVVGLDPIQGYPRFTFGSAELLGGVEFIPVMIGLFGFSEGLSVMEKILAKYKSTQKLSGIIPSFAKLKKIFPTILGSSVVGMFVGSLPGTGGDIAAFVAYNESKRWSKDKDTFGKGNIKGVAAAESGNKGCTAGALVPTLTLGIPGDSVTAILIGALMVHGLQPGPLFFEKNPELAFGFFIGFMVVYCMILIFGLLGAGLWIRLISTPANFLWPIIFVLCVIGSFSMRNSIVDIWIMLGSGILGYFMRKDSYPLAPVVLGIILGPIAESNLRRAMVISGGNLDFLYTRPITLFLIIASFISIIMPIIRTHIKRAD